MAYTDQTYSTYNDDSFGLSFIDKKESRIIALQKSIIQGLQERLDNLYTENLELKNKLNELQKI